MSVLSSPLPNIHIPDEDLFSFLFRRSDREFPDSHVIFQDALSNRAFSYHDIDILAQRFGHKLISQYDWQKGDVLAISSLNDINLAPVIFGALWAGATVSTSNPSYTRQELAHQLQDCGAKCVVAQKVNLNIVLEACHAAGLSEDSVILLDDEAVVPNEDQLCSRVRSDSTNLAPPYDINPREDVAFLIYSSGTTGKPKGVRLTHYNIVANILQLQIAEGSNLTWNGSKTVRDIPLPSGSGGDKILAGLPFFHIYGLTVLLLSPVYCGVTTFVIPRFQLDLWCRLVQDHKITFAYVVPPIVLQLAKDPTVASYDLSSLRMTQSGAAPLSRDLIMQVFTRLNIRVKQGYGLSETSPCLFQGAWDTWDADMGSCGVLLPNLKAKIIKPLGGDLVGESSAESQAGPNHTAGELYVKGPNVFAGYHNNTSATAECLSSDGWFRTGDIGYLTDRNNLVITDRVKELIKYKGFQVAPAELEGILMEYPMIVDCAVVGVNDKDLATEVPTAYIVKQRGALGFDIDALTRWFNKRVVNYKRLRGGVHIIHQIPKNASGKILRRQLRDRAQRKAESAKLRAKI